MAVSILSTLIKGLSEASKSELADTTDLIIEGDVTKRTRLATLAEWIRGKLGIGTASSLTTTSKEVVGAINELNTKLNGTRQFARFELSGIDLEAGVTKQVIVPVTGLEGKTTDAVIVTPIGGYVMQTSVVGRRTSQVTVALRSDQAATGRTIELYIFYH